MNPEEKLTLMNIRMHPRMKNRLLQQARRHNRTMSDIMMEGIVSAVEYYERSPSVPPFKSRMIVASPEVNEKRQSA